MVTRLNPYLSFRDTAREAMEFYRSVFGGELTMSTFAEYGMETEPGEANLLMHAMLESPGGLVLMGADTPSSMEHTPGGGVSVSLSGDDLGRAPGLLGRAVRHRHRDDAVPGGAVGRHLRDVRRPLRRRVDGQRRGVGRLSVHRHDYQPRVPGSPLKGPTTALVIQPP